MLDEYIPLLFIQLKAAELDLQVGGLLDFQNITNRSYGLKTQRKVALCA
jgi:hypothetical protein